MRLLIENLFAVAAVTGAEAWFLKGYFAGQPDFEPALAFIAAIGVLLLKDPIKAKFSATENYQLHDRALFEDFLGTLPAEPTIGFLRDHDFGNTFRKRDIEPLYEFVATGGSVEKEFLDRKLEKGRKVIFRLASELATEVARRTVPVGTNGYISVFSDRLRASGAERPPHVIEDARVLNSKSTAFVPEYETFVRRCRARLAK